MGLLFVDHLPMACTILKGFLNLSLSATSPSIDFLLSLLKTLLFDVSWFNSTTNVPNNYLSAIQQQ